MKWWDGFPVLKEEEYYRYIINVLNLVSTSYKNAKYFPVAEEWISRLGQEKPGLSYHNQKLLFRTLSLSRLLHFLNQNDFYAAKEILPEMIEEMNKLKLNKSIVLIINIVTVYFLTKDYKNCMLWADYIIKNLKTGGREDIQRIVRIYRIIALYETGEIDKLEADIRSANRFYKAVDLPKDRFENMVLNVYLKRIFNASISEQKEARKEFEVFLNSVKNKINSDIPLGVDELLIWNAA